MSQSEKKNWLERLQRESWELELLISGFVLILLLQLPAQITSLWLDFKLSFSLSLTTFRVFFFAALFYSFKLVSFVLIFHLSLHILSRGFWIGLIGLSSVYPDGYNIDSLDYNSKIKDKIKKRVPQLKELILKIDDFISINFSFTFLILCLCLGMISVIVVTVFPIFVIFQLEIYENILVNIIFNLWLIYFVIGLLLTFVDFISAGFLKKGRFGVFYFNVFNRFFRKISLSFIYETLYYTFISRLKKRFLSLIFMAYILGLIFLPILLTPKDSIFKSDNKNTYFINANHYEDVNGKARLKKITIPSLMINKNYLEVFIGASGLLGNWNEIHNDLDASKLLSLLRDQKQIYIDDSIYVDYEAYLTKHPENKERGILILLDISKLSIGKHVLKVEQKDLEKILVKAFLGQDDKNHLFFRDNELTEDEKYKIQALIPFYKE